MILTVQIKKILNKNRISGNSVAIYVNFILLYKLIFYLLTQIASIKVFRIFSKVFLNPPFSESCHITKIQIMLKYV